MTLDAVEALSWPRFIESTRHNLSPIIYGAVLAPDRSDRPGHAYAFDGVDDYVEVPDDPSLKLQKEYSLVLTFKPTAYPSTASGVVSGNGTVLTMHLLEKKEGYRVSLLQLVNRPPYQPYVLYGHGTGKYPLWHTLIFGQPYYQLVFTYANRTLRVALNGEIKDEVADVAEPVTGTGPLILGNRAYPEEQYYSRKFFQGVMDQLQIFDWALSNEEITKLHTTGVL